MCKIGFTLIESLIYLFLASLSLVLLAQLMVHFNIRARSQVQATRQMVEVATCMHYCMSHLKRAPIDDRLWYRSDARVLMYRGSEHVIGWFFEGDRLVKCTGSFDGGTFKRTSTAVILEGVTMGTFKRVTQAHRDVREDEKIVSSIIIEFEHMKKKYTQCVALLLGIIA